MLDIRTFYFHLKSISGYFKSKSPLYFFVNTIYGVRHLGSKTHRHIDHEDSLLALLETSVNRSCRGVGSNFELVRQLRIGQANIPGWAECSSSQKYLIGQA